MSETDNPTRLVPPERLLPCPFCGGNAQPPQNYGDAAAYQGRFVQCQNSQCHASIYRYRATPEEADAALAEAWNRRDPNAVTLNPDAIANRILNEVMELPDRTSPEDWPEAMLVTGDELVAIVKGVMEELKR